MTADNDPEETIHEQGDDEVTEIIFGDEIDLHHFHFKDTGAAVGEFLNQAMAAGLERIRIVHGKGMSKKKEWVYGILDKDPRVKSYINDGSNWGATIVFLNTGDE